MKAERTPRSDTLHEPALFRRRSEYNWSCPASSLPTCSPYHAAKNALRYDFRLIIRLSIPTVNGGDAYVVWVDGACREMKGPLTSGINSRDPWPLARLDWVGGCRIKHHINLLIHCFTS